MKFPVDDGNAVALRRKPGSTITIINQSLVDVYFDRDPNRLNKTATGSVPDGTKLAAAAAPFQWPDFPGVLWFRAATKTVLEVQP